MRSFFRHMGTSVWDLLLVLLTSCGLSWMTVSGLVSGDAFLQTPVPLLVACLVELVVLYALAYSKRTALAGIAVVPILIAISMVAASAAWDGAMFADEVGNVCTPLLMALITTLLVFLLSRRRPGVMVLIFATVLTCGYLQFIYKENHFIAVILALFGCLCLLIYRGFTRQRAESHQSMKDSSLALAAGLAFALVLTGAGCGIYAAVINPLHPPTMEIKLIKEYLALPTLDATGIADKDQAQDQEKKTNKTNEQQEQSSGEQDQTEEEETPDNGTSASASNVGYDSSSDDPGFNTVTHDLPAIYKLLWVLVIVALVIGIVVAKRKLRRKKLDAMLALPPKRLAREAYLFFMRYRKKLGLPPMVGMTPVEYAQSCRIYLDSFDLNEGSNFEALTKAYVAAVYGDVEPTAAQLDHIYTFYDSFYENCRSHMGLPKYLLFYFFL